MKFFRYISFALFFLTISCVDGIEEMNQSYPCESEMALMANLRTDLPPLASKALIDQNTTQSMDGNFLRIDENTAGSLDYEDWDNAYIIEASVVSSPNSKGNRSIYLNPVQSYKVTQNNENENVYHHTRMVGWYPKTINLSKDSEGKADITKLNFYDPSKGYDVYEKDSEGNVSIVFNNLDGTKDIMMSEILEAQQYHNKGVSETDYRLPFGDNTVFAQEDRIFTYKHFLSAIKVYAKSEESDQVAGMWGRVLDVVVKGQVQKCKVQIPKEMTDPPYKSEFSSTVTFEGEIDYSLEKGPIFGDYENDEIAQENPLLTDELLYLGYSLIEPNQDIQLDVHTESGVYSFEISSVQDDGGNAVDVFQAGYIYNIELDFKTDGTISAMVFTDNQYTYFDLSSGVVLGEDAAHVYQLANCYIVDREKYKTAEDEYYDGYAFYAGVMGNGDSGIPEGVNITSTELDAKSAALVWESKRGLVTNVQFIYDYVRFRVNNDDYSEGNAVIAVYDGNNEIIWSWHIWITDTPEDRTFGDGDGTFVIMDRNLGALDNGLGLDSYGLYYQWGRKDPSMPPPSQSYPVLSTSTSSYYDYYGDELHSAEVVNIAKPTIEDAIKNPMYILLPTEVPEFYHYDWLYERQDHLWAYEDDPNATSLRNKTIFDPCPFGYRTPKEEIGTIMVNAFDNTADDVTGAVQSYGIEITNGTVKTYFPFAGYKGVDKGISSLTASWKYVGEKGDYLSANINATNNHRIRTYLSNGSSWEEIGADSDGDGIGDASASYNASKYDIDYANRRVAASVRCVKADTRLIGTMLVDLNADCTYILSSDPEESINASLKITAYTSSISSITVKRIKNYENGNIVEETINNIPAISNPALYEEVVLTIDKSEISADLAQGVSSYEIVVLVKNTTGVSKMKYVTIPVVNMGVNNILVNNEDRWNEGDEVLSGTYYYGVQNPVKIYAQMPLTEGGANMYDLYVNGVKFNPVTKTEDGKVVLDYFAGSTYIGEEFVVEFRTSDNSSVVYTKNLNATVQIPSNYTINESSATRIYSVGEMVPGACYAIVPSAYNSYYWTDNSRALKFTQDLTNNSLFIYHQDDNYISNVPTSYTYVSSGKIQSLGTGDYVASNSTDLILNGTGESYIFGSGSNGNIYIYDSAGDNYVRYTTKRTGFRYRPDVIQLGTSSDNTSWNIYQVPLTLN